MARPTYVLQLDQGDPDAPLAGVTWTDITPYLDVQAGYTITRGRGEETGDVNPSTLALTLKNTDGRFTKGNAGSPYYPNIVSGKRVRLGLVWGGSTYWRFTGDVNEWPTEWSGPGLYAEARITATDRLGRPDEYLGTAEEDVNDDSPFAYYPLGEPAGALSAGDVSGNAQPPLVGTQVGVGGRITLGDTTSQDQFFGQDAVGALFTPAGAGDGRYLTARLRAATSGSATGAAISCIAQEGTSPPVTGPVATLTAQDGSFLSIWKSGGGNIGAAYYDGPSATLYELASGFGLSSTYPAHLAVVLDVPGLLLGRITFYYGGTAYGTPVQFPMTSVPQWVRVSVGGTRKQTFKGDVWHAAFYDHVVAGAAFAGQGQSALLGLDGAGNTTYGRLAKLCVYSGLGTLQWSNGGGAFTPQSVGPQQIRGDALEAMRLIERTEAGMFYLMADGRPILRLRQARYNLGASLTLAAGKYDLAFRGDSYGVANDVTYSRPEGGSVRVVNESSRASVGRRVETATATPATDDGLRSLATWRAYATGVDRNRVTGVRISLLNDPGLVPAALSMDLGGKITVTGLPSQAPAASLDFIVEGWTEVGGENEWSMSFVTSSADPYTVWQLGVAGRSELGTTTILAL